MISLALQQQIRLATTDPRMARTAWTLAQGHAGTTLGDALRDASPGGVAEAWSPDLQTVGEGETLFTWRNTHPAAAILDGGATWPGKMPPWKPGTPLAAWAAAHNRNPFLVARALKYGSRTTGRPPGLAARHFVAKAIAAARPQIQAIWTDGARAWLHLLSRGSG